MVQLDRVRNGVVRFIDEELAPKMSGAQKWVFVAAASALLSDPAKLLAKIKGNAVFDALEIVDANNNVDVDKIYRYIKPQAEKGPATISLPIVGTILLDSNDVDKIYSYIMGA